MIDPQRHWNFLWNNISSPSCVNFWNSDFPFSISATIFISLSIALSQHFLCAGCDSFQLCSSLTAATGLPPLLHCTLILPSKPYYASVICISAFKLYHLLNLDVIQVKICRKYGPFYNWDPKGRGERQPFLNHSTVS